jgi:hypothetical protein
MDVPFVEQLDSTGRHIASRLRPLMFPMIPAECCEAMREQRIQALEKWSVCLRWTISLFLLATAIYVKIALPLVPAAPDRVGEAVMLILLLLGAAFQLQRAGLLPAGDRNKTSSITTNFRRRLEKVIRRLVIGHFDPAEAPFSSGLIALTALLMVFMPSYPILRRFNGFQFSDGITWAAIAFRFLLVLLLFSFFVWIWKASRLAAKAARAELGAIEGESVTLQTR